MQAVLQNPRNLAPMFPPGVVGRERVVAACDANDGVKNGIYEQP
jgi:hypothetical protein